MTDHVKASLACDITKIIDMMQDAYSDVGMLDMRSPSRNLAFINNVLDAVECTDEYGRSGWVKTQQKTKSKQRVEDTAAVVMSSGTVDPVR